MTSNPTIFEKAIGAGNDYDEQLRALVGTETRTDQALRGARDPRHPYGVRAFAPLYDSDERRRRLRLPRSLADARARHGRARSPRRRGCGRGRPSEPDDQDPRHARGPPGDPRGDRSGHQRQRHVALLGRAVRGRREALTSRGSKTAAGRGSRSTGSPRSPASSSRASTPRSTKRSTRRSRPERQARRTCSARPAIANRS